MLTGAMSALSNVASGVTSMSIAHKNKKFSAQEAQKQRDYNSAEAAISRQFQAQQVNQANHYNSITEQMKRAKDAGVNPNALLSGGATVGSTPAVTGGTSQAESNATGQPSTPDLSFFGDAVESLSRVAVNLSQANKNDKDSELSAAQAQRVNALLQGEVEFLGLRCGYMFNLSNLTEEQAKLVVKNQELADRNLTILSQEITLNGQKISRGIMENKLFEDTYNAKVIQELCAAGYSYEQARYAGQLFKSIISMNNGRAFASMMQGKQIGFDMDSWIDPVTGDNNLARSRMLDVGIKGFDWEVKNFGNDMLKKYGPTNAENESLALSLRNELLRTLGDIKDKENSSYTLRKVASGLGLLGGAALTAFGALGLLPTGGLSAAAIGAGSALFGSSASSFSK